MFSRSSGILLHISSLPGKHGIGSLGKEAYKFADFLCTAKQSLWQILPLCPTGSGNCPYLGISAFAGNHLFIDIDLLVSEGLLKKPDSEANSLSNKTIDYTEVNDYKTQLFKKAYLNFSLSNISSGEEYQTFCGNNALWLDDYSLFMALLDQNNGLPWYKWEKALKFREKNALKKAVIRLVKEIEYHKFLQFLFFRQWFSLKKYVNEKGIKIIGDNPIYLSYDSCDVWINPELFLLDKERNPIKVSGVPPDFFSASGQLWGHPLYNWAVHKKTDFDWWVKNMKATFNTVDILRIDHFIGFVNYWAVPYGSETAINGVWQKAPGISLFKYLKKQLGNIPIIAEDLGNKTPDVDKLMKSMNFPGMKLLQEGITGGSGHPFAPHNFDSTNYVVYTSTHDSNTVKGWYSQLKLSDKKLVLKYLKCTDKYVVKEMVVKAWSSVAVFAIAQMQDILELGSEARMNTPGTILNNWNWRMKKNYLTKAMINWLSEITKQNNR
jgi:4-alpha-glucanotransferase